MVTVGDIYNYIDTFAPFHTAMGFDNVGLLVGGKHCPVTSVMVSLDITPEVISEAVSQKAELIISHHPVIFQPLKRLSPTDVPYLLVQNGLCAIAAHTNYDLACGGVNACLAERLQLKQISMLEEYEHSGLAASLIGQLETEMKSSEFAAYVKTQLECKGLKFTVGKTKVKKSGRCLWCGFFFYFCSRSCRGRCFCQRRQQTPRVACGKQYGDYHGGRRTFCNGRYCNPAFMQPLVQRISASTLYQITTKKTLCSIWFNSISLKGGETWL